MNKKYTLFLSVLFAFLIASLGFNSLHILNKHNLFTNNNSSTNNIVCANNPKELIQNKSSIQQDFNLSINNDAINSNILFPINKDSNLHQIPLTLNNLDNSSIFNFYNNDHSTLELDLNIYKPIGLKDDIFLQNTTFDLFCNDLKSGLINQENISNGTMFFNISNNDYNYLWENKLNTNNPNWCDKNNYNNLFVKPTTITNDNTQIKWTNKLFFNFLDLDNSFKNNDKIKYPYAYLVLKIAHIIDERIVTKPINKVLIKPYLMYSWNGETLGQLPPKPTKKQFTFKACNLLNKVYLFLNQWGWNNPYYGNVNYETCLIKENFILQFTNNGDIEIQLGTARSLFPFFIELNNLKYFDFHLVKNGSIHGIEPSDIFNEIRIEENKNYKLSWKLKQNWNDNQVAIGNFYDQINTDNIYVDLSKIPAYESNSKRLNIELELTLTDWTTGLDYKYIVYLKIKNYTANSYLPTPIKPDLNQDKNDNNISDLTYMNGFYFNLQPNNHFSFILKSNYFNTNDIYDISANDYISAKSRFNLYEKILEEAPSSKTNNNSINIFLTIDTTRNQNEIILSPYEQPGLKIEPLLIDTSNFYFDSDQNHFNTNYLVKLEGLKFSDTQLLKQIKSVNQNNNSVSYQTKSKINFLNSNIPSNSNNNDDIKLISPTITFDINDLEFNNSYNPTTNTIRPVIKTIKLFNNTNILDEYLNNNNQVSLNLKLEINPVIEELLDNQGNSFVPKRYQRVKFKYEIVKLTLNAHNTSLVDSSGQTMCYDITTKLHSSNSIEIKTSVKDFNYLKMVSQCIDLTRKLNIITSNYSSNIFDNHYILNNNDQVVQSNYSQAYNIAKTQFNQLLTNEDFLKAQNALNINLALFNQPFIQTSYNDYDQNNNDSFRSSGNINLKYSLINPNKYFQYINLDLRFELNRNSYNGNEIVDIDFNNALLNTDIKRFSTIDLFVHYLNNEIDNTNKLNYLNVINKDNNIIAIEDIIDSASIVFRAISGSNRISASFNLKNPFYFYNNNNYHLINQDIVIHSNGLNISVFNPNKINASLNNNLIVEYAKTCNNYQEFQTKYSNNIIELINISDHNAINSANFVNNPNNDENAISIEINLTNQYIFNNDLKTMILTCNNINWKNQNNEIIPIAVDLKYDVIAHKISYYTSVNDFINQNLNPDINNWINAFIFKTPEVNNENNSNYEQTTINDLSSIRFEPVLNSFNKIKVILVAKSWRYFAYEGTNINSNEIEFVISNLYFKNQTQTNLTKLDINIDIGYLYNLLKQYYINNKNANLQTFINQYQNRFIMYGNNQESIIKINPYIQNALISPPIIRLTDQGIYLVLDLNDKFYWNKTNNYELDQFYGTYTTLIKYDELKQYHEEVIKPNSKYAVSEISLNTIKIANDAKKYNNINEFLKSINSDYDISSYLNFLNIEDINKIKTYEIKKVSNNSFNIIITLFDQYYFLNQAIENKTKVFEVNNLLFKNQTNNFIAVSININTKKIAALAKTYNNVDELINYFKDKHNYENYQDFISINKPEAIKNIDLVKANSNNSILIDISLNNGYYFINKDPIIANQEYIISNLLFKNDPSYEEVLISAKINFKGNEFLSKAQEFTNFELFKNWLFKNNNWKSLFDITFNKQNANNENVIKYFNIFQTSNHIFQIQIVLLDGYYFQNENYNNLTKNIMVGNVYFKDEIIPELIDIDIRFNTRRFYLLTNNKQFNNWNNFINYISPLILNFKDNTNAILLTNAKSQDIFSLINVQSLDNELIITLQLVDNYYFDKDNKSNINLQLNYNQATLEKYFNQGKEIIDNENLAYILTIVLSTTIPLIILSIVIICWIINTKIKNKKHQKEMGL